VVTISPLKPGEKYEIQDWESLLSDFEDFGQFKQAYPMVVKDVSWFQKNFAYTTSELTGDVVNFFPYYYQDDWNKDDSLQKIVLKSRQVGFTVQESFLWFHRGIAQNGYHHYFYHIRERNVTKFLDTIRDLNDNLIDPLQATFSRSNDTLIKYDKTIWEGLSSGALESSRGFTGGITLDEFGIAKNTKKIMASAGPVTSRGFSIHIGSTPLGKHNEYHRIVQECGWNTDKSTGSIAEYKQVEVDARKLFTDGYFEARTNREAKKLMYKWIDQRTVPIMKKDFQKFTKEYSSVQRNNPSDYSLHVMPFFACPDIKWTDIMKFNLDYDSLLQEYFLAFLDEATSMLTMEEIKQNIYEELMLIDPAEATPYGERRVFCGLDPSSGKVNETAWLFVVEPLINDQGFMLEPWKVLHYETTWDKRKKYVPRLIEQIKRFKPVMIFMDGTGIGIPVSEDLIDGGISEGIIDAINLSNRSQYEPIIYNLVSLAQSGHLMLPDDPRLIDQMYALEKGYTKTNKAHFTGKINSSDGQDDLVWSLALAVSSGTGYKKTKHRMESIDTTYDSGGVERDYRRGSYERYT
jgi:hypothetical protein